MSILNDQIVELQTVLEIASAPSLYVIWSDTRSSSRFVEVCRESDIPVLRFSSDGDGWINTLTGLDPCTANIRALLVEGGLSSIAANLRPSFNANRERFLTFARPLFIIEPIALERELRAAFPDLFAVVRQQFYLETSVTEGEDALSLIVGKSLDEVGKQLPDPHIQGSLIYTQGQVHFKGPPVDRCPRCGKSPKWLPTTLTFRHAPVETQVQATRGWVCECGEKYVPGMLAKEAHRRAFQKQVI